MNELPRDAKELLALARTAEEPPAAARERVQRAVALTLAAGVAASTGHAAASSGHPSALKVPFLATLPGKLALVSGALIVLGAGMLAWPRASAPRQHAAPVVQAPVPLPIAPAPSIPVQPSTPTLEAEPQAPVRRARKAQAVEVTATDDGLRAEMTMLHAASLALDHGDIARARSMLNSHRTQYANGQLREERQGLEVLARCLAHEANAASGARAYLRSTPRGVLASRVARACLAEGEP